MKHAASPAVPKLWPGSTAVLIGGGPSLFAEDVDSCRGKARVICVNDAYRLAPWADVLYGCDAKWWKWHKGVPTFAGLKYSIDPRAIWPGVTILKNTGREGLELEPTGLRTGMNSGYQAMNLAVHFGAKRIVLLGYDMQTDGVRTHWFGDHPQKTVSPFRGFMQQFDRVRAPLRSLGITVVNCSRRTALTSFPRMDLAAALPEPVEMAS